MDTRILPPLIPTTGGINRTQDAPQQAPEQSARNAYKAPPKTSNNQIPSPEQLDNLINRALEARSNGVYWDRGSIVNVVL